MMAMPVAAKARAPTNVVKYVNLLVIRSILSHYQTTSRVKSHNLTFSWALTECSTSNELR